MTVTRTATITLVTALQRLDVPRFAVVGTPQRELVGRPVAETGGSALVGATMALKAAQNRTRHGARGGMEVQPLRHGALLATACRLEAVTKGRRRKVVINHGMTVRHTGIIVNITFENLAALCTRKVDRQAIVTRKGRGTSHPEKRQRVGNLHNDLQFDCFLLNKVV